MKKLSQAKRHAIYIKATNGYAPKDFSDRTPHCLCFAFASILLKQKRFINTERNQLYKKLTTILPEFGMFNPQTEYSFERWWHNEENEWTGGDEERYLALAFMIEMSK